MGALTTAAKAARIQRDIDQAEHERDNAAKLAAARLAEYQAAVDAAHEAAIDAFGVHGNDITWSRLHVGDVIPYGSHPDLPARLRFSWLWSDEPDDADLRLVAVPVIADGATPGTWGRPVPIGQPAIASLADLGDALAAWEDDQGTVGR